MFEQTTIEHHIQKHILQVLVHSEYARYSDMRPEKVDSNLYAYHLNKLLSSGYVRKDDQGYTLNTKGLRYVEYASSSSMKVRSQPKITTAVLLTNINGEILLTKRMKQPYINYYGLPLGKIYSIEDKNILDSAIRELYEKTGVKYKKLSHAGDLYLKIHLDKVLISDLLIHVFKATCKKNKSISESSLWIDKNNLNKIKLVPGVKEIIKLSDNKDTFFEEISV